MRICQAVRRTRVDVDPYDGKHLIIGFHEAPAGIMYLPGVYGREGNGVHPNAYAIYGRDSGSIGFVAERRKKRARKMVPELDLPRIRTTLAQLSGALETEDHVARLDEILRRLGR